MNFRPKYQLRRIRRTLTDPRACVYLLNEFYRTRELTTNLLDEVVRLLDQQGILARPMNMETLLIDPVERKDLVLAHHPVMDEKILHPCQWLGIIPLNRRQRLELAQTVHAPVMPWRYASSVQELVDLFDVWKTDVLLLKKDVSLRALGVNVVRRKHCSNPELSWGVGDIFCPLLTEDPITYKMHFWGKHILGSFALHTPPIESRTFTGLDQSPTGPWEPPTEIHEVIGRLGEALLRMGGGYSSVDMMRHNGRFVIVEINTNSVGFDKMLKYVPIFSQNYTNAVVDIVQRRAELVCPRARIIEGIHYFQEKLRHNIKDAKKLSEAA